MSHRNLPERRPQPYIDRPPRTPLFLSENNKIGGVCGGLAEWSGVDPLVWRLGFVLAAFFTGVGIPAYLVLWAIMDRRPPPPEPSFEPSDMSPEMQEIWGEVKEEMRELDSQFR